MEVSTSPYTTAEELCSPHFTFLLLAHGSILARNEVTPRIQGTVHTVTRENGVQYLTGLISESYCTFNTYCHKHTVVTVGLIGVTVQFLGTVLLQYSINSFFQNASSASAAPTTPSEQP